MKRTLIIIVALVLLLGLSVTPAAAKVKIWNVPGDFDTIQEAINDASVQDRDIIQVSAGNHAGAIVNRPIIIKGEVGATITIGVPYKVGSPLKTAFRLDSGADGTEISHLSITNDMSALYYFAVFSRYVDDVSIHHLTITNSVQAITNYNGSGWGISYNKITGTIEASGGGIGIMINAWDGTTDIIPDSTTANNNVIMQNLTEGVGDALDYSGPGILLSSGHGANHWPGGTLTGNIVYKNKCIQSGVGGVGLEVDDVSWDLTNNHPPDIDPTGPFSLTSTITGNTIIYNDLRGSTYPMDWYGDESMNTISRNLTDPESTNRGEGNEGRTPPEIFD